MPWWGVALGFLGVLWVYREYQAYQLSRALPPGPAPSSGPVLAGQVVLKPGAPYFVSIPYSWQGQSTASAVAALGFTVVGAWIPGIPPTTEMPRGAPAGWMADWATQQRVLLQLTYAGPATQAAPTSGVSFGWKWWVAPNLAFGEAPAILANGTTMAVEVPVTPSASTALDIGSYWMSLPDLAGVTTGNELSPPFNWNVWYSGPVADVQLASEPDWHKLDPTGTRRARYEGTLMAPASITFPNGARLWRLA